MENRGRVVPGGTARSPESALASELFDQFVSAGTFKSVLATYRQICEVLRLKPTNFTNFYPRLKAKLPSWRAASLWAKLDKRASHKCYNRGKACPNTRVLIIGAGPCGLRAAIEAQLLGAKVVLVEKRDRFSRNNVLHLWPFVIHDLRSLGAKKFFGKFCAGSIDHISIRQLQIILLKVALLLGVEVHENVGFESLIEPLEDQTNERVGWHARVSPPDHPVSLYEFDVLIGADGKRNTLLGFNRKEFRGKLAIAVTANFINRHTIEEARVPEISGVAFIFNQKFFQDMREQTAIDLENIVYYKDDTHYFVMTAKKQSLLERGVIIRDYNDTARLLAPENVDREALMEYARDAADFATNYQLPSLDFAVNHYGQADVAMFDFTSMYAAENACRVVERRGHKLLQGLVGDSLLEPFWPTGSGCARGFLSSFDSAWMIRSWASGRLSTLQVLAERESIYRLLAQTTPENLSKDLNQYTVNPSTRYPNLNLQAVLPSQVRSLFDTDGKVEENIDVAAEVPKKKRRKESMIHPDTLLNWCRKQVALSNKIKIQDFTTSWKDGLALCAILHRYRPDLIDLSALDPENIAKNNQLAFDICERELGIPPIMTGQEMAECDVPDKLTMVSYISQVYESFRGEIPFVLSKAVPTEERTVSPSRQLHSTPLSILNRISSKLQNKRKYSIEKELSKEKERGENVKRRSNAFLTHKRRSRERGVALEMNNQDVLLTEYKSTELNKPRESINTRVKNLEDKMKRDAGLRCHASEESDSVKAARVRSEQTELSIKLLQERLQKNGSDANVKKCRTPKVGKLRKDEWNVKIIEEKIKQQQNSHVKHPSSAEKPKILKDIFVSKLQQMDEKLKAGGSLTPEEKARYKKFDDSLHKLKDRLSKGNLNTGERGQNQTAAMTNHMAKIWDKKAGRRKDPIPPAPVFKVTVETDSSSTSAGSEICYFCKKRVYLMERLSAEGLFFHRSCFKCEYCSASLRLGNYSFDRDAICGGKFYCTPHFRMQKPDHRWQEMMKRKQAFLSCALQEQEKEKLYKTLLDNTEKALSPQRQADGSSPAKSSLDAVDHDNKIMTTPNLLAEPSPPFGRDQTPERVEYENSIIELSEEELLTSELEEEELTQKNLGPCQDLATSEDEYSDLSTDTESDEEAFAEELERSLTADETRKLAETWNRKYSVEQSLIDSISSSSADDEESDTEIGTDDTSDDVDSDAEYSIENSEEDGVKNELENQDTQISSDAKECFTMEVPVIDLKSMNKVSEDETTSESDISEDLTDSEEGIESETGTEVDSESESKPSIPPLIPTIVIHESPPQDVDLDQEWNDNACPSKVDAKKTDETVITPSEASVLEMDKSSAEKVMHTSDKLDSAPALLDSNEDGKFNIVENADKDIDSFCFRKENELFKEFEQLESVVQSTAPLAVEESSSDLSISSGINSLAKEIVSDVMKAAKNSVMEREISVSVSNVVVQDKVADFSDSTPNSVSTSSASESEKWLRLKSTPSSEEAKVELIDLCTPEKPSTSKLLNLQSETEIEIIDLCSPASTVPLMSKQDDSLCFDLEKEIQNGNSSQFIETLLSKDRDSLSNSVILDCVNVSNKTIELDNTVNIENVEDSSVLPCNNSLNSTVSSTYEECVDESPQDVEFDTTFVTLRKKKRHSSDSDVFNWESDKSISLPWSFIQEDSINVDDDDVSKDGIYHANVVQAVESCSKHKDVSPEQIILPGTANLPNELSQSCGTTLPRISKSKIALSKQDSIDDLGNLLHEKSFHASEPCFSDLLNDAKLNKLVPKNEVLPEESNVKDSCVSEDTLHSDIVVPNDRNTDHNSVNNMSNSVMSTSLNESRSESTPESSPKDGLKYKGYSGSFAEKIRPKSLFCDTIYLRSLDIKLQKQPFSSLNKSDDKLDDCSKTEYNDKIRKKLFDDNKKSNELISKSSAAFNETEKNDFNSSAIQKACLKSNLASSEFSQKILNSGAGKLKSSGHKHSSVSFSAPESHCDLVSPYTCAQIKPSEESSFPTKMKPKCDMDINKLRQKREKRKSVHEDIQGLPFADEEKVVSPVDPLGSSDVFYTPKGTFQAKGQSNVSSSEDVFLTPVGKMPDLIDEERYLRLQSTAEQEKARQEARARARLKSDEELGLSPNNYRKKYRRQLSLNSINYDELCSDEFCDQDEELEDDVINSFCQKKNSGIEETFTMFRNSDLCFKAKTSDPPVNSSQLLQQKDAEILPVSCDLSPSNISPFLANVSETSDSLDVNAQQNVVKDCNLKQASKHSSKNSSSETSPEVFSSDASPFDSKYHKGKMKSGRSESCGDDDKSKSNGKKSIFSILNFGKGNVSKEKVKQKSGKDLSSSLPNDIDSRTTSRSKPFSHLKLAKSKEKIPKPKARSAPPEDASVTPPVEASSAMEEFLSLSVNTPATKIIPKYTVYRNPETMISTFPVHLPVPKLENGLAPKASEDSFSDEDDTQGSKAGHIPCLDKNEKNSNEKEKKAQRIVQKVQKQQVLKRLRNAQEIQRRLEELEIQQKELEQQGVEIEKIHRGERHRDGSKGEAELMQEWYTLIHSKNKIVREEQELMIRLKDLELEDRHSKLQQDMRERMAHSSQKDPTQIMEEGRILAEMLEIVEKRDELVAMLEQLRLREVEEEKNLNSEVFSKGMKSPLSPSEKS
ncbi:LOW QUALITY PROTEIN: protein-methionine sulfoxide oxidase mical3a-like [Uloborus diversus]|uniref:LOW QUALITY PROTEIN: protein-methionine sulfoxide oxidase mical3a-like n=1 Tax=Uloborus diversus TaxID=327109 RepID=UPI002409C93D|nr:LOW QUALITY PROTEIN: protein-methionine sulfoxide oxidase mical3a-like [Uloborus diversus]